MACTEKQGKQTVKCYSGCSFSTHIEQISVQISLYLLILVDQVDIRTDVDLQTEWQLLPVVQLETFTCFYSSLRACKSNENTHSDFTSNKLSKKTYWVGHCTIEDSGPCWFLFYPLYLPILAYFKCQKSSKNAVNEDVIPEL